MNDHVIEILKKIISEQEVTICRDPKRCQVLIQVIFDG